MGKQSRHTLHSTLRENVWFAVCDPAFQEALTDLGQILTLNPKQEVFAAGSSDRHLYGVITGELVASNVDDQGNISVLSVIRPGKWIGEIAFFDGLPRTHTVHALKRSRVLRIHCNALERWLQEHPKHWRDLGCLMSAKLRIALEALQDDAILPLESRILRRLQLLSSNYRASPNQHSEVTISQELLAQMLGVSRQSTSKTLKGLEARGVIKRRYAKVVLLQELSGRSVYPLPRPAEPQIQGTARGQ